ncbi:MAG: YCF48-related protein [Bacteroidota bacterium]
MKLSWTAGAMVCVLMWACQSPLAPETNLKSVPALPADRIQSIAFANGDTVYAVGGQRFDHTLILRSLDGGQNWEPQLPDPGFEWILFDVEFLNGREGLATGLGGFILRTNTIGRRWLIGLSALRLPIHAVEIVHDSLQFAVGGVGYDEGVMLRSENMGRTWSVVDSLEIELRDVQFVSSEIGFSCGYGAIFRTSDGGSSWELTDAKDEFFTSLSFPTPEIGYACGRTGTIIKTTDGGNSWEKLRNGNQPFGKRYLFNHVYFLDATTGYVVGDQGVILKTTDAGDSWQAFEREPQADWYRIHLFEEGRGLILGSESTMLEFHE